MSGRAWVIWAVAASLGAGGADAQYRDHGPRERHPSAHLGIQFLVGEPQGEFGRRAGTGFGGQLEGRFDLSGDGVLHLRVDGGFLVYGHERERVCFSPPVGCHIDLDLTTSNAILYTGVGPELSAPGPMSPYVNASVGLSYFTTRSSLSGSHDHHDFASTEHFGDLVLASRVGGGVRMRLSSGGTPVALDVGATYHRNGQAEYLTEGDIVDHPDGSITLFTNRTEANLVTFRFGVSIGLGGKRDRRHGRRH